MAKNGEQKANSFSFTNLRDASEYKLKISPEKTEELKKKSQDELVEELQIHQIELQMQNEELKKNQILLEVSRDKYVDLYDFAPTGYFVFNHLSLIEEVNLTGASFLGIERNKILNHSFRQFVYPDNHEIWDRHIHNVLKHDEKQTCDLLLISKNGYSIYVQLDSIQLQSEDGKTKIRTAMSDITNRKLSEKMLRESEKRLLDAQRIGKLGSLDLDLKTNMLILSEENLVIFGLEKEKNPFPLERLISLVHPQDVHRLNQCLSTAATNGTPFEMDHRIIRPDGSERYVRAIAELFMDPYGKPIRLFGTTMDITERKKMEEELRESEQKYRSSADDLNKAQAVAKIGSWKWDLINSEVTWSDEMYLIFGIDKNSNTDRLGDVITKVIHPDDLHIVLPSNASEFASKKPMEYRIILPDKSIRYIYAEAGNAILDKEGNPIFLTGIAQDITMHKLAEESLRESEAKHKKMTTNISDVIAIMDKNGTMRYKSPNIEKWFGWLPEDLVGTDGWATVYPDDLERIQKEFLTLLEKDNVSKTVEYRYKCKDGSYKWIELTAINLTNDPIINGVLMNYHDITERKQAEENLKESHRKLEETLAKLKETQKQILLQEKLRSLGQMTSGICHDINNSLSPIMGYTEMLSMDQDLMKKHDKKLANIIKSTKNIARTIGRLKEFYKVKLEVEVLTEKDINKIINSTIELTSHKWKNIAESTGSVIKIKRELQKDLPLTKVDESELIEALTNIILNACDSMIDGGTLTFRTYQNEANIVIEVQDTGLGMDEETLHRCMDPFYSTKGEQGTGLGLSMVFGVMDRHKGEIKIESEKNIGTTVKLILPVDKSIIENDKIDEIVKDLKPLKILSVEDDKVISEMLKLILETKGNRVESALNGKVGLGLYKQALEKEEPFDLVITDLGMAEMDGNSLSKAIKEITPDTRVILLTGWGTLIDKNDYKTVDCLLKKPIMMEDLFKAISGLFEDK